MTHRRNEWRSSEPDADKLHLNDKMRAKMVKFVVKFFQGVLERKGPLVTGINKEVNSSIGAMPHFLL